MAAGTGTTPPGGFTELIQRIQSELTPDQSEALLWLRESNAQALDQWQGSAGDAISLAKSFLADCSAYQEHLGQTNAQFSEKLTQFAEQLQRHVHQRVDVGELRIRFQLELDKLRERCSNAERLRDTAIERSDQLEKQMDEILATLRQQVY